jgi:hypothetical protein
MLILDWIAGVFCCALGYSTSLWNNGWAAMALVEKSVLLPYSAEQMFVLVDNVAV